MKTDATPDQCRYCEQRDITDMAQHLVDECPIAMQQWGPVGKTGLSAPELTAKLASIDREALVFKPDGTYKIEAPATRRGHTPTPWQGPTTRFYTKANAAKRPYGRHYPAHVAPGN